jgi:hypothetical protein
MNRTSRGTFGKDVLPTGDDHVVVTSVDEEPALFVEVPDVAAGPSTEASPRPPV